jgi:hypothetical protein
MPSTMKQQPKLTPQTEATHTEDELDAAIDESVKAVLLSKAKTGNANSFLGLAELGKRLKITAEPDLSSKIDDYLYGDDSSNVDDAKGSRTKG